jgi:hypothetical protein
MALKIYRIAYTETKRRLLGLRNEKKSQVQSPSGAGIRYIKDRKVPPCRFYRGLE